MWRLIIAIILFLISLLTVIKAPTNFFWLVAVAVTEFPYIPVILSSAFLIFCFYTEKYKIASTTISAVAVIMYLLPIIEAYRRSRHLDEDLLKEFPYRNSPLQLQQPFSVAKMFSGIRGKEMIPQILTYKKLPERDLNIDFFAAENKGKKLPCVIVIHGGSWAGGDSKQLPALNSYLAARGYHVAAINYRLAPKYKFPAPVEDTKDVMQYLVDNAEKLNIDTTNFVLLGRSAGAQIALVAAYTFHNKNIKGVISYYGPADMFWGAHIKSNKLVLNTDKVFRDYLGGLVNEIPETYHEAGAYDHVDKTSTPTLLIHGPNDVLVSYYHSVRLDKKLNDQGIQHYFLNLPWATHGCDYNINGPSGQITTYATERFINSVTSN